MESPGDLGDGAGHARAVAPMRSRAPGLTVQPIARPAMLARAISLNNVPDIPVDTAGAAVALVIGKSAATVRISGAAITQPGGTDSRPTTLP